MFRKKIEATKIIKKSLLLFLLVDTKGYSFLLRSRSCLSKKNITVDPIRRQLTLNAEKDDSDIEHDNDISFFQDFQNAKVRKLGADIPISSHIQESIKNSENDFLSAMKQVKTDFQRSKEKFGLNQAIDMLKQDWDEEDRLWDIEIEKAGGNTFHKDQDDHDDINDSDTFQ